MEFDIETGSRLVRAARAMARMNVADFAEALAIGEATIKRLEAGTTVRASTIERCVTRLNRVGVVVTEPDPARGLGPGVALLAKRKRLPAKTPSV